MIVIMDWEGERYRWVLDNKIKHTVVDQGVSPITFQPAIVRIEIPDSTADLTLFLLRWA